jgi:tetratricopeptide (TPR) repeat protein
MKRTDRFGETKSLLRASVRAEKEILLAQLQSLEQSGVRGFEKATDAIKVMISKPSYDRKQVLSEIGLGTISNPDANAFFLSLKGAVLENMVQEVNLERPGNYGNRQRTKASNAKKILQSEIMLSKGLINLSEKILEEVLSRSIKYELFDQALAAQRNLRFLHAIDKGIRTFNRFSQNIEETVVLRDAYASAEDWYLRFELNEARNRQEDPITLLENSLASLKQIIDKTGIAYARYLHALFTVKLLERTGEYRKAKTACDKLIELIKSEPAVMTEQRESQAHYDLALILIHLRKLDEAKIAFAVSQNLIKKNSHESYLINKALVALDFYQDNAKDLDDALPKLIKSKYTIRFPYAVVQFHFYKGLLEFIQGDFKSAARTLKEELDLATDLSLDNKLGINLYLFMAGAELAEAEKDFSKEVRQIALDNLNAVYGDPDVRKRDRLIIRLVRRTAASELDYDRTATLVKDSLPRLDMPSRDLRWEPLTYEVIPFGLWLNAKIKKRKMAIKLPPVPKPDSAL